MAKPTIIEEKEVPMFIVKQEFKKINKREGESNFRVQKTEEYLNTFTILSLKTGKEFIEKLQKLKIPRLQEKHMYKIADIMPRTVEELKVVMQGYPLTINNDNLKKISKVVVKFLPEIKEKKEKK